MKGSYPGIGLLQLLWLAGLLGANLGWGRRVLQSLKLLAPDFMIQNSLALGLGWAMLSYLFFILAALHGLAFFSILLLQGCWMIPGLWFFFQDPGWVKPPASSSGNKFAFSLMIYLGILALANLLVAITPAVDWDGVAYHLALPKIYLLANGLVFRPDIFHNLFPQFTEMLYLPGLVFPFGSAAKLVHFSFGLLAAAAVYAAGRASGLKTSAWLATAIFYTQFIIHVESGTAFIDLASAAYMALALLAFLLAMRPKASWQWLYLAMFFLGVNAATKWHGLILLVLAFGLAGLKISLDQQSSWSLKGKRLGLAIFWGSLPVWPYLGRAWLAGNNPIWPLGYGIFGGLYWDHEMASRVTQLVKVFAGLRPGIRGLLYLPYDLLMHGEKFGVGGYELRGPLAGMYLLMIAGLVRIRWLKWQANIIPLTAGVLGMVFIGLWYQSSPQIRFLLGLFPLAAWLAARLLSRCWQSGAFGKTFALLAGICLFLVHPPIHRDTLYQVRAFLGQVSPPAYLTHYLPHYPACVYLNQQVKHGEKILLFGENRGFYLERDYLWGDPMLQLVVNYRMLKTPEKLWARMQELKIGWVLFRTDLYDAKYLSPETIALMSRVLEQHAQKVYEEGPIRIYQMK